MYFAWCLDVFHHGRLFIKGHIALFEGDVAYHVCPGLWDIQAIHRLLAWERYHLILSLLLGAQRSRSGRRGCLGSPHAMTLSSSGQRLREWWEQLTSNGNLWCFPVPSFSWSMDNGEMALAERLCPPPVLSLHLFLGPVVGSAVFSWAWVWGSSGVVGLS